MDKKVTRLLRHPDLTRRLTIAIKILKSAREDFERLEESSDRERAADAAEAYLIAERRLGEILDEGPKRKDAWIEQARREFTPSERRPCAVCGKLALVSHAHHIVPLSDQYDRGFDRPDHSHEWLCPNHHALVHLLLTHREDLTARGRVAASVICELSDEESPIVLKLIGWRGREE